MSRSRSAGSFLVLLSVAVSVVALQSGTSAQTANGAGAPANVSLRVSVADDDGPRAGARLSCRGATATARGYLRNRPVTACRTARRIARFLASRPSSAGACIQVYGGPQRARVRGTIGSRSIDRRFARRDGCEIADWDRARVLLPRVRPTR